MKNPPRSRRPQRRYYSSLVADLTGLSVRTLNDWAGPIITPEDTSRTIGPGVARHWRYRHLVVLRVAKLLRDTGLGLPSIQKVISYLLDNAETDDVPLDQKILLTDGQNCWVLHHEQEIGPMLSSLPQWSSAPGVFVTLHLGRVADDLEQAWQRWYAAYQARKKAQQEQESQPTLREAIRQSQVPEEEPAQSSPD